MWLVNLEVWEVIHCIIYRDFPVGVGKQGEVRLVNLTVGEGCWVLQRRKLGLVNREVILTRTQ